MELTLDEWMKQACEAMIKTHYHRRGLEDAVDALTADQRDALTEQMISTLWEADSLYHQMGRDKIADSLIRMTEEALQQQRETNND